MTTTPKALPALPEGWPARFRCDSCDGNGEIGEPMHMGHLQPPERERCPDCGGRGWSVEEDAFNGGHMHDYAQQAIADHLASAGGVEVVAYLVSGGRIFKDQAVIHEGSALTRIAERKDGTVAHPLVKKSDHLAALTKEREVADGLRAELEAVKRDAVRIDWIQRQGLDDFAMGLVIDAPHDGEYWVSPDSGGMYYGKTLRKAIDAAIEAAKENGNGDR